MLARRPFIADTDLRGMIVHRRIEQGDRSKFEGSPDLARYLPRKVRYPAIVVAKDAKFSKPAWW